MIESRLAMIAPDPRRARARTAQELPPDAMSSERSEWAGLHLRWPISSGRPIVPHNAMAPVDSHPRDFRGAAFGVKARIVHYVIFMVIGDRI